METNEAVSASRYLGKAIWRRQRMYHRRSLVEAKMNCIKLLEQSLMARDFDRQVAEVQVRVTIGIPITEVVGQIRPGKGKHVPHPTCSIKPGEGGAQYLKIGR